MDFRAFDRARRQAGPLELDLVESYAKGSVSRREFVRRGTLIGLSLPFMSAIISACGSDGGSSDDAAGRQRGHQRRHVGGTRHGHARRDDQGGEPEAGRPARPGGHAGPRHLRHRRPVLRVPGHPGGTTTSLPAWPRSGRPTTTAASGRSSCARASSGRTARTSPRPMWPPRWTAWSTPATPASRASSRRVRWTPPTPTSPSSPSSGPNGNFPYLVSVYNAQSCITPGRLRHRDDARRQRPTAPVRSSWSSSTPPPARRSPATTPGGAARPPLDGAEFQFFDDLGAMVTAEHGGRGRRHRPVPGHRRRRPVQRPRTSTCWPSRPRPTARSGCAATRASSPTSAVRQALAYTFDREQMIEDAVPGTRPTSATTTSSLRSYPFFYDRCSPSARRTSRRPRRCCPRPACTTRSRRRCTSATCRRSRSWPRSSRSAPRRPGSTWSWPGRAWTRSTAHSGARPSRLTRPARAPPSWASSTTATGHPGRLPQRRAGHEGHLELLPVLLARVRRRVQGVPGRGRRRGPDRGLREDRDHPQRGRPGRPAVLLQLPVGQLEEVPGRAGVSALGQMFLDKASQA